MFSSVKGHVVLWSRSTIEANMSIERQFYYGDYGYPGLSGSGGGYCCERKADIITVLGKKLQY